MRYQKPYGVSDPNAGYTNGNPTTGTEGSIPPAEAIEHPMREIEAVIVAAGMVPSATVLTQLRDAIQALIAAQSSAVPDRALLHYGTASGTADVITVDATPNLVAYVAGATVIFLAAAENTGGAASLNVEGLGPAALKRADGVTGIRKGDLAAGSLAVAVHDGTNFRLVFSASAMSDAALWHYGEAFGTANALQVELRPGLTAAAVGISLRVRAAAANTGAATLDFGFGAKPIVLNSSGAALTGGELQANVEALFFYDGTSARLVNPVPQVAVAASDVTLTSSADLSIPAGTDTIVPVVGSNPAWATLSGGRLTITKRGLYTVNGYIALGSMSTNQTTTYYYASLYKNGAQVATRVGTQGTLGSVPTTFSQGVDYVLFLDVGDIIDLRGAVAVGSFSVAAASINAGSLLHLVKVA